MTTVVAETSIPLHHLERAQRLLVGLFDTPADDPAGETTGWDTTILDLDPVYTALDELVTAAILAK